MGLFFGTDGLRGIFGETLTSEMAYKCGYALSLLKDKAKVVLGRDTRKSGTILTLAFSLGFLSGGGSVEDVGVCPTAGISYLTTSLGFDFGVVISASHNSSEFNGIKIFGSDGLKLGDLIEYEVEKNLLKNTEKLENNNIGKYLSKSEYLKNYEQFLINNGCDLSGLKIVLDCANGAAYKIAEEVFKALGAEVKILENVPNGENINNNSGALFIHNLSTKVKSNNADIGFAFDGDSDRVLAVDEKGNIVDGDKIIYLFAKEYDSCNKLERRIVVGTKMTNMGVEIALKELGIDLVRTDVGDKYVSEELIKRGALIGGEQCGHIFVKDRLCTGDGILNAILIAQICKKTNKKLSEFFNFELYNQEIINVKVKNKNYVLNCKNLTYEIKIIQNKLKNNGRILVRASGTEPLIRIMVEAKEKKVAMDFAEEVKLLVEKIDRGEIKCAE